jgi:hypothetical protein
MASDLYTGGTVSICRRRGATKKRNLCNLRNLRIFNLRVLGLVLAAFIAITTAYGDETKPSWEGSVTTAKGPGKFPAPPDIHLTYRFGWSGITAAEAEVRLVNRDDITKITASGGTTGFARTLFKCDIDHECTSQRDALLPIHIVQDEKYSYETVHTTIEFNEKSVTSLREVTPTKDPPKPRTLEFYPVYSLETALLWLRSQPLNDGEREVMAVYANNAAYLATIKVVGRERIHIGQTDHNAIKVEFNFKTIDQHLQLKTYKRFKSGRGWISDDEYRLPLRVEADIFIGYVFAELETSDVGM